MRQLINLAHASLLCLLLPLAGCYQLSSSGGGGQVRWSGQRKLDPADIAVPAGYRVDVVTTALTFPTAITFDDRGRAYVVESGYSYGETFLAPRLLRIEPNGTYAPVATGQKEYAPWNGAVFHDGAFYVAEGGQIEGGRISRIDLDGTITPLLSNLPSMGDHQLNGPAISEGFIYFGVGTATNSGIVGLDNLQFGWLSRHPHFHDIPGKDVTLTGENFLTDDPFANQPGKKAVTGAYSPFGTPTTKRQVVPGQVLCTGAILRIPLQGGTPELVAWGFRNPFGLAFGPDGELYVTENQADVRGSRPVWGTGDLLWRVVPGLWYGWPDYYSGQPLSEDSRFKPPGGNAPRRLLADTPNTPPIALAKFGVHSASCGLDFSRSDQFGHVGEAFVAQFGDLAPVAGKVMWPVGYKVVRVDPKTGIINGFAVNRGSINGPASKLGTAGLERPIAVRFAPDGKSLYIVDFGLLTVQDNKLIPQPGTGSVWRIVRE